MGQMRFLAQPPEKYPPCAFQLAYLAGQEAIAWPSYNQFRDGTLTLERSASESGHLYIPWSSPGIGQRVLSTCSLMERELPYQLPVELARGTLHRARTLVAAIESQQLSVPSDTSAKLENCLQSFIQAVTESANATAADESTARSAGLIEQLSGHMVNQILELRRTRQGPLPCRFGVRLDSTDQLDQWSDAIQSTFHAASLPFRWSELQPSESSWDDEKARADTEWCRQRGLQIFAGPLLQLETLSLPEWIACEPPPLDQLESHVIRFLERIVGQFEGQVDVWNVAGRLNVDDSLGLTEEDRLRLAVTCIEVVRQQAPRSPLVITFDQPWAEYLASRDLDLSPLHFADALVRADLGVSAIGLEVNLGYWPHGTLPRDLLDISRHLDRWSLIGIPLLIYLTVPSSAMADPNATVDAKVVARDRDHPELPAIDHSWVGPLVKMLVSKPAVHSVIWNQLSDAVSHEFAHSGLIDALGKRKPTWSELESLRNEYLV